jgi:ubiquitin carboxyl-terminal hydrolase 26/29/37
MKKMEEIKKKKKLEDEKIEDPFITEEEVAVTAKPKDETNGTEPNSYRIIGIVNHLGLSSNSGHYTSDVLNLKTNEWSSFDDSRVKVLSEENVLTKCSNTGYIFFYINNSFASSSLK